MKKEGTSLGVVIPTLDEEGFLPSLLADLGRLPVAHRIVVADGGSSDRTVDVALRAGAVVVRAPRGRARQMNVGAAALSTPWLLFLHADSRLPSGTLAALAKRMEDPPTEEAAYFSFRLDARGAFWSLLEYGQRARERLTGMAYGDQGLLVSRRRWVELGGIPDLPIMEDVEAVRRLRRTGGIRRIDAPVVTSARRYRTEGRLGGWLRNVALVTLYRFGVPAPRLAPWYAPRTSRDANGASPHLPVRTAARTETGSPPPGTTATHPAVLLVFAKAPRPGRVKTRLATDLGDAPAARIYRTLGRRVVDQLQGGAFRTVICFSPPDGGEEVRRWLGPSGLEFSPQSDGDLGERMRRASDQAFRQTDRVCIVGTDAPGVDRERVERALTLLDEPPGADAVFGPALDGGYYLLALRHPAPALFRDVPWSTPRVLETSLRRAREAGLRVRTLEMLADVDHLRDVPDDLLESG